VGGKGAGLIYLSGGDPGIDEDTAIVGDGNDLSRWVVHGRQSVWVSGPDGWKSFSADGEVCVLRSGECAHGRAPRRRPCPPRSTRDAQAAGTGLTTHLTWSRRYPFEPVVTRRARSRWHEDGTAGP